MRWIKAKDRLPETTDGRSKDYFCRNVRDGRLRVFCFGKNKRQSMLYRYPDYWEWLDIEAPTDYDIGYRDAVVAMQIKLSFLSPSKPQP